METFPLAPTLTITRFAIVQPFAQLTLEAVGRVVPPGYRVRKPAVAVLVAVTFRTTADTPVAGTPPAPRICRSITLPVLIVCAGRVSRSRDGDSALYPPAVPLGVAK